MLSEIRKLVEKVTQLEEKVTVLENRQSDLETSLGIGLKQMRGNCRTKKEDNAATKPDHDGCSGV